MNFRIAIFYEGNFAQHVIARASPEIISQF